MALLAVAKNSITDTEQKYSGEDDLRRLLLYCSNHCSHVVMNKLYALGIGCICDQFLYLQSRRVKPVCTRAIHYTLDFDTGGLESDIDISDIRCIMVLLSRDVLAGYQNILFLHTDKPSHYHIHIVINPVRPDNLQVCNLTFYRFRYMVMELLALYDSIPLQTATYRDHKGRIRPGNESGLMLYQDKFQRKYGLPDQAFE